MTLGWVCPTDRRLERGRDELRINNFKLLLVQRKHARVMRGPWTTGQEVIDIAKSNPGPTRQLSLQNASQQRMQWDPPLGDEPRRWASTGRGYDEKRSFTQTYEA